MVRPGVVRPDEKRGASPLVSLLALLLALLMCWTAGCAADVTSEQARRLLQAQQAFDQAETPADYAQVAAQYQALRDAGLMSGSLLYNQGNAFVRAQRLPEALAAYRAAMRYLPRDPRLQANLRLVETRLGVEQPRQPAYGYVLFWQDWLSSREKFLLASVAVCLWLGLATVALVKRSRWLSWAGVTAAVLAVVLIASATLDWYRFDAVRHGVIRDADTMPRKGDAESYGPVFTEPVAAGTAFTVVQSRADWLLVEFSGGHAGWIRDRQAVLY